ncbi:hypothetical protein Tco_0336272 [Tanacetum coccineum]
MSSSSTITYTSTSSDYEEPSDVGSPGVVVYGYDRLPIHPVDPYVEAALQAPPSLDYVPGPEHPPSPNYVPGPEHPPSPVYVPEPEYPKYLVPSDVEAPMKDQPLPDDASPTALSPGYIADSDPEEDPEEDPADYPADGEDDADDESSDDDDDVKEDEEDDDEEEEHLALTNSLAVPTVDPVPLAEDTEAFEIDESAPTPIPLPPLPLPSPTHTSPTYVEAPLCYKAVGIRLRAKSPPLLLPSTSHRDDIPKADLPPQKRLCLTALTSRFEVGKSSSAAAARQRGRVNMLFRDRRFHCHTSMLLESEVRHARDAWSHSMNYSKAVHAELQVYRARVNTHEIQIKTQDTRIRSLGSLDLSLQTQLTTALGRIQTLEAREPAHTNYPKDAGSDS